MWLCSRWDKRWRGPLDARTRLLLEAPPGRTILRLAWPNMLVMVAQSAIGLIETYFVARLGSDALAGIMNNITRV